MACVDIRTVVSANRHLFIFLLLQQDTDLSQIRFQRNMAFLRITTWSSEHFWAPYIPNGSAEGHLALTGLIVHLTAQDLISTYGSASGTQCMLSLCLGLRRNKRTESEGNKNKGRRCAVTSVLGIRRTNDHRERLGYWKRDSFIVETFLLPASTKSSI